MAEKRDKEKIDLRYSSNKVLLIDIDSVLAEEDNSVPIVEREVIDGARASLSYLKKKGFILVLHTSRFRWQREDTIKWLQLNEIPFDDIVFEKPRGILYIDERGYRFNSWKEFWEDIIV